MDLKERKSMDVRTVFIEASETSSIIYNIVRDKYAVIFNPTWESKARIFEVEDGFHLMHSIGDEEYVKNYLLSSVPDTHMIMRRILLGKPTVEDYMKLQNRSMPLPLYIYHTQYEGYAPATIYENKYYYFNGMDFVEVQDDSRIEIVAVGKFVPNAQYYLPGDDE